MTVFNRDEFLVRPTSVWQLPQQWVVTWYARARARRERRDALLYMAEMPDWQLKDIGLRRGDVHRLLEREKLVPDRVASNQPH